MFTFFSDLPFNTRLLIRNFFFNLKIMFVLKDSLLGLGFVLLLYVLRKVTICYVPLTQEKWSIATVRPILRETLPKSVRFPSVVATMTKTRQNVRINSMPTPCTRVWPLATFVTPRLAWKDPGVALKQWWIIFI